MKFIISIIAIFALVAHSSAELALVPIEPRHVDNLVKTQTGVVARVTLKSANDNYFRRGFSLTKGAIGSVIRSKANFAAIAGTMIAGGALWAVDELTGQLQHQVTTAPIGYEYQTGDVAYQCGTDAFGCATGHASNSSSVSYVSGGEIYITTTGAYRLRYTSSAGVLGAIALTPLYSVPEPVTDDELGDAAWEQYSSPALANLLSNMTAPLPAGMQAAIDELVAETDPDPDVDPNPETEPEPLPATATETEQEQLDSLTVIEDELAALNEQLQAGSTPEPPAHDPAPAVPVFTLDKTKEEIINDVDDTIITPDDVTTDDISDVVGGILTIESTNADCSIDIPLVMGTESSVAEISFCDLGSFFSTLGEFIYVLALMWAYLNISRNTI